MLDFCLASTEDGSKPRWLDKAPVAAHVHEMHVLRSESTPFPVTGIPSPTAHPPKGPTIDSFDTVFRNSASSSSNFYLSSGFEGIDKKSKLQHGSFQERDTGYPVVKSETIVYLGGSERGSSSQMDVYVEQQQPQQSVFGLPLTDAVASGGEFMSLKQPNQVNSFDYPRSGELMEGYFSFYKKMKTNHQLNYSAVDSASIYRIITQTKMGILTLFAAT